MLEYFDSWKKKTATFKQLVIEQNDAGQPVETEESVYEDIEIQWWETSGLVTNTNDSFLNQTVGQAMIKPGYTITTSMWFEVGTVKHWITNVDEVAAYGDVVVLSWRRENG